MDYIISILPQMWEGTLETIRLFTITIVLSIPLGVLLALGRVSGLKPLRDACLYITVCRLYRAWASGWMTFRLRFWRLC